MINAFQWPDAWANAFLEFIFALIIIIEFLKLDLPSDVCYLTAGIVFFSIPTFGLLKRKLFESWFNLVQGWKLFNCPQAS